MVRGTTLGQEEQKMVLPWSRKLVSCDQLARFMSKDVVQCDIVKERAFTLLTGTFFDYRGQRGGEVEQNDGEWRQKKAKDEPGVWCCIWGNYE